MQEREIRAVVPVLIQDFNPGGQTIGPFDARSAGDDRRAGTSRSPRAGLCSNTPTF